MPFGELWHFAEQEEMIELPQRRWLSLVYYGRPWTVVEIANKSTVRYKSNGTARLLKIQKHYRGVF